MKKLYIKTHGCQMNEYDSKRMAELLNETEGYQLVDRAEDAWDAAQADRQSGNCGRVTA